jgi:hypothetical protein
MAQASRHQVEELAVKLLRRQQNPQSRSRLSLLGRWREARYRRALATAPVEPLITALTQARNKHDTAAAR